MVFYNRNVPSTFISRCSTCTGELLFTHSLFSFIWVWTQGVLFFSVSTACCFQLIFMLRLITLSHLWPWRSPLWSIRLCPLTLLIILGGCSAFCPLFQAHCGPGSPHASLAPVLEQLFFQRALVPLSGGEYWVGRIWVLEVLLPMECRWFLCPLVERAWKYLCVRALHTHFSVARSLFLVFLHARSFSHHEFSY